MNCTDSKEPPTALECVGRIRTGIPLDVLTGLKRVAILGTSDVALAQRLSREVQVSAPRSAISVATGLAQIRELLKTCSPSVIFIDSDLLGGLPLADVVRQMASVAPVLVLASLNAQADIAKLVADDGEGVDFIARVGDFVPLASALIARTLKEPRMPASDSAAAERMPSGIGELFRHEINNPLTGILGNAELVLAHRERFSDVEIQRLQTVVDLAVLLRENIRRISNSWEHHSS